MGFLDLLTSKAANKSVDVVATAIEGMIHTTGWSATGGVNTVDVSADSQVGNIRHVYTGVPWCVDPAGLGGLWTNFVGPTVGDIVTLSFKGGHPGFPIITAWQGGPEATQVKEYSQRDKTATPHAAVAPPATSSAPPVSLANLNRG